MIKYLEKIEKALNLNKKAPAFPQMIRANLRSFKKADYAIFFLVVPALLIGIYLLPIDRAPFILNTQNPTLLSFFPSNFVHVDLQHLENNLIGYFISMLIVFGFEKDRRFFYCMAAFLFLAMPIIASFVTILSMTGISRGFSAIMYGYLGYAAFLLLMVAIPAYSEKRRFKMPTTAWVIVFVVGMIIELCYLYVEPTVSGVVPNRYAHMAGFGMGALLPFIYYATKRKLRSPL